MEGRVAHEFPAGPATTAKNRRQDSNLEAKLLRYDSYRLDKIRVVGNQHADFEAATESITKQVGGDVDVGSLFLCLDHAFVSRPVSLRQADDVGQEVTEDNLDGGVGPNRSEVRLLTCRLIEIVGSSGDSRCEVLDATDLVGGEQLLAHHRDVQPLVARAVHTPVVEVEGIDVYDRSHGQPSS